jgi:predicted peptidase
MIACLLNHPRLAGHLEQNKHETTIKKTRLAIYQSNETKVSPVSGRIPCHSTTSGSEFHSLARRHLA